MTRISTKPLALAIALLAAMPAHAADIDTTVDGINGAMTYFGTPNTATFGQTFLADGNRIKGFSLYLMTRVDGFPDVPLTFRGYIGSWDGTKLGNVLYRSAARYRAGSGLKEFTFDTGSIAVTPGQFYVAFLSVSEMASQADSAFTMPTARHAIPGNFFFQNNGHDFGRLTTQSWAPQNEDAYLKVQFNTVSGVPEPGSWALLIAGLGITGAAIRHRRDTFAIA